MPNPLDHSLTLTRREALLLLQSELAQESDEWVVAYVLGFLKCRLADEHREPAEDQAQRRRSRLDRRWTPRRGRIS